MLALARWVAAAVAAAVLVASSAARADQPPPDPFADYSTWKAGGESGPLPTAAAVDAPAAEAATKPKASAAERAPDVWVPTERGTWLVGARGSLGYTGAQSDLVAGGSRSDTTFFVHVAPSVGYMLRDRLLLGGSFGPLIKSVGRENDLTATETAWLLEANVSYVLPIIPRLAFVPGLGIGGYVGSSERGLRVAEVGGTRDVVESTSTRGLSLSAHLGVAYQLAKSWQLRTGLRFNALVGSESVASANQSLASSSAHFALPVEFYYTF